MELSRNLKICEYNIGAWSKSPLVRIVDVG